MSRRAMGRRVAAGSVVGTALVVSLTGCLGETNNASGGGGIKLAAAEAITASSQKAGQVETFQANVTIDNKGTEGTTRLRASGQFRLKPTLAFSAAVNEVSRNGSSLPGGGSQVVLLDNVGYARIPQLSALGGGKPWVKVDLNQLGDRTGVDTDQILSVVRKADPAEQTKIFTASKDVRTVGTEEIDGVKTTHYQGTVTLAEALAAFDANGKQILQKYFGWDGQADTAAKSAKAAFDVWIDNGRLPRKVVAKVNNAKDENSTITAVYSDYGKPVHVTAPPADQVGTFSLPG